MFYHDIVGRNSFFLVGGEVAGPHEVPYIIGLLQIIVEILRPRPEALCKGYNAYCKFFITSNSQARR